MVFRMLLSSFLVLSFSDCDLSNEPEYNVTIFNQSEVVGLYKQCKLILHNPACEVILRCNSSKGEKKE